MARPSKLTREVQETFVAALRTGAWFSDACRIAGVKKSTAHEWHRRGRGEDPRPPTPAHVAFAQAVDAALAERGTVAANGHLDEFAAELTRANQSETGDLPPPAAPPQRDLTVTTPPRRGTTGHDGAHSPIADALRPSKPQLRPPTSRIAEAFAASSEQGDNRASGDVCGPDTARHPQPETPLPEGEGLRPTTPEHGRAEVEFAGRPPPQEQGINRGLQTPPGDTGDSLKNAISAEAVAQVAQPNARARDATDATHQKGEGPMELEVTIRIPVGGATMTIPTRERIFDSDAAGGRVVDSVHVADVGGLQSVEFVDGKLFIELKTGERYAFPIAQLLTGRKEDAKLELRETLVGRHAEFSSGHAEKIRLHEVQLARLHEVRLVEPESSSTPERWSAGSRSRRNPER